MADEAVVRIVIQDKGGQTTASPSPTAAAPSAAATATSAAATPPPPPPQFDPMAVAQKRLEAEKQRAAVDIEYAKLQPSQPPPPPQSAQDLARKRLEAEKQRAEIDAEYAKLNPPPPPPSAIDIAQQRLEAEKKRAEIDAEYAKLNPPAPPPSAHDLALKRLEAEKQRQEVEAEYAKLKPPTPEPPFDPKAEARKRREGEQRAEQVNAAYKEQFGDGNEDSMFDQIIDIAGQFRGVIGGLAGAVVGASLDAIVALRKAQVEIRNKKSSTTVPTMTGEAIDVGAPTEWAESVVPTTQAATAEPIGVAQAAQEAAVGGMGEAGTAVGGASEAAGEIGQLAGAAGAAGGAMAAAVPAIGAAVAAIGLMEEAAKAFYSEVNREAEKYGQYSPELAQAQAMVDVRSELGNLRRAQDAGPELARYIEVQGKLQQDFEEIKVKLMTKLLTIVTPILETLEAIMPSGEGIENSIRALTIVISPVIEILSEWSNAHKDEKYKDIKSPTDIILHGHNVEPHSPIPTPAGV